MAIIIAGPLRATSFMFSRSASHAQRCAAFAGFIMFLAVTGFSGMQAVSLHQTRCRSFPVGTRAFEWDSPSPRRWFDIHNA